MKNTDPQLASLANDWKTREPLALPDPGNPGRLWLLDQPPPYYLEPEKGVWLLVFRWYDIPPHPDLAEPYPSDHAAREDFARVMGRGDPLWLPDPNRAIRQWMFDTPLDFSADLQPCGGWAVASHHGKPSPLAGVHATPEAITTAFAKACGRA